MAAGRASTELGVCCGVTGTPQPAISATAERLNAKRATFPMSQCLPNRSEELFLRCRHAEREDEVAGKDRDGRTPGRVLENLAVIVTGVPTIDEPLDDPRLRAVAGTYELYRVLQRRLRSADCVLIERVRDLIEHRDVRAVPLHGTRKFDAVAGCDRSELRAALRELDEREAGAVASKAVSKKIPLVVIAVEEF